MGLAEIIALVNKGLDVINIAVQVGAAVPDVVSLVNKVKGWVSGTAAPTQADSDEMDKLEEKYLGMLNDTSRDEPDKT